MISLIFCIKTQNLERFCVLHTFLGGSSDLVYDHTLNTSLKHFGGGADQVKLLPAVRHLFIRVCVVRRSSGALDQLVENRRRG